MPPKAHRSTSGLSRHSRSSSGGASRAGLNLQFTQKEKESQGNRKAKGANGNLRHELSAIYPSRTNSESRIQSKAAAGQVSRTASNSTTHRRTNGKPDFIIAQTEADDDEWVSSESGPVTPNNRSDDEDALSPTTTVDFSAYTIKVPVAPGEQPVAVNGHENTSKNESEVCYTPRAALLSLSHQPTSPVRPEAPVTSPPIPPQAKYLPQNTAEQVDIQDPERDRDMIQVRNIPTDRLSNKQFRSEAGSPPTSVHVRTSPSRKSSTRPPSLYSINCKSDVSLRPHPLIRRQSFGYGMPTTPRLTPLEPLTTITGKETLEVGSTLPSSPGLSHGSNSPPTSISNSLARQIEDSSEARRQLRRQSTSSQASVATIARQTPTKYDRQRTMSNISVSSLSALSSFAHHISPPRTPVVGFTSHFSPEDETPEVSDLIQNLLPPEYLSAHLTVLTRCSPIMESYERVMKAKRQHR